MDQGLEALAWLILIWGLSVVIFGAVLAWLIYLVGKHWIITWGEQCRLTKLVPESRPPTAELPPTKFDELRDARRGSEERRFQP